MVPCDQVSPRFPAACVTGETEVVCPLSYLHQQAAVAVQSVADIVKLLPPHHLLGVDLHILEDGLPLWRALRCLTVRLQNWMFCSNSQFIDITNMHIDIFIIKYYIFKISMNCPLKIILTMLLLSSKNLILSVSSLVYSFRNITICSFYFQGKINSERFAGNISLIPLFWEWSWYIFWCRTRT